MPGGTVERKLTAILAADVASYSRLIGKDEEGTLARLGALRRELIDPKIAAHFGRIVKTTGDGLLVEFTSVVEAVRCAVAVQRAMAAHEAPLPKEWHIAFRVGINFGDIVVENGDIMGEGVNIAARLEGIAKPGGICLSGSVHEQVFGKVDVGFADLGEQRLKNINRRIRVYRVVFPDEPDDKPIVERPKVGWYDPHQLFYTALQVVTATVFGRNADNRVIEALASEGTVPTPYDYSADRRPFWIDYISDTGDGWDATYAVAFVAAQPQLSLSLGDRNVDTERGSILVFGGDEVYPTASLYDYQTRLVAPYETALPPTMPTTDAPHVFAVPGNHDWYDSLVSFSRLFCIKDFFARWLAPQERSYFALRLPRGWWLLGTDIQLGSDLDLPQQRYFERIAPQIAEDERIILCHAEPHWIYESIYRPDPRNPKKDPAYWAYQALDTLEGVLGARVAVYLAGDLHHYCRHESENHVQAIVAGGGGAFLHLTNGQDVTTLTSPRTGAVFNHRASWPDRAQSNRLCLKNLLFPIYNPWFGAATGALYTLVAWTVMAPEIGKEHSLWAALGVVLDHAVRDPGAAFSIIAVFAGFLLFTDTHSRTYRLIAGPIHGLTHLAALFFISWAAATLTAPSGNPSAWQLLASVPLLLLGGYLAGSLIMGLYLFVSLRLFRRHLNEASSSLGGEDWKNFLRLRIAEDGTLTIFPIGIRRVARTKRAAVPGETPSRFIPEGGSAPELIEQPIVVAAPPAALALRTSTDPAPPRQA